jgi:hypothetical protein
VRSESESDTSDATPVERATIQMVCPVKRSAGFTTSACAFARVWSWW